jgi:hypothetical protein
MNVEIVELVDCLINHPTNTITMVVLFAATGAWLWRIGHPYTPWSLFGRGSARAVFSK